MLDHGATHVMSSRTCCLVKEIRSICPDGVKYVFNAGGSSDIINQDMEIIRDCGEILCYGASESCKIKIDWSKAPYNWKLSFQQMPFKYEEREAFG